MKKWTLNNKWMIVGAIAGSLAGFAYYKYVGCITGTCAITSNPYRSTLYFAVLGAMFFSLFKRAPKEQVE